jgi:CRISPR/Cas system endoribonuclease Cas6 (RAMP superfamily)
MTDGLLSINLPILSCTVKGIITREIYWNSFPGSVIHGILGYSLKDYSCVVAHRNCKKCYLVHDCNYGMVFETPLPKATRRMRLYPQAPHPFKIAVYPWDKPVLREGEQFVVDLTLYGKATTGLLMILMSLERAFADGIGRKKGDARGNAVMLSLTDRLCNKSFDWVSLKANYQNPVSARPLSELLITPRSSEISLRLKSPLKLVTDGKVNFKPSVRDIASNILRRLGNLYYFYEGNELTLEFERLLTEAESAQSETSLRKVSAVRYSSRQNQTISVGGLVGEINIKKPSVDLSQLLMIGQLVGIGKSTTMGLGDYEVR